MMKKLLLTLGLLALGLPMMAQEDEDPPLDPPTRPDDLKPYSPALDRSSIQWWNQTVWYEVYVRSFQDSDGDGVGDLKGLISKLDYLNDGNPATKTDLGITGLWLMPIFKSTLEHGYDVTDYQDIKTEYGTMADMETLLKEAHKRGIKVILDVPFNHVSYKHPWFISATSNPKSPYRDYFRFSDTPLQAQGPDKRPCWHPNGLRTDAKEFFYGVFNFLLPDLNLANPAVTAEIQKITKFWIDKGIDGFRLDAVKYFLETRDNLMDDPATFKWLADYFKYVKSVKKDFFLIGETWTKLSAIKEYTGGKLDAGLNFPINLGLISSFKDKTREALEDNIFASVRDLPNSQWGIFLSNHDQNRFLSDMEADLRRGKLGAMFLLTAPGIPFLYYGEEIGMRGTVKPSDVDVRRPFQWTIDGAPGYGFTTGKPYGRGITTPSKENNAEAMRKDPQSLWNLYRNLIDLRDKTPALISGQFLPVESTRPRVLSYIRSDEKGSYLVVLNLSGFKYEDYTLHLWNGPLKKSTKATTLLSTGKSVNLQNLSINNTGGFDSWTPVKTLEPFTGYVIELK